MNHQSQKPPNPWSLIVLFFVITISIIIIGLLYYNYQKKNLLSEEQLELSAISDLKIRQITQWRLDRIGNGIFLGENSLMVKKISEFLNGSSDKSLKSDIVHSLKSLTENFDYRYIYILDLSGNVRLSYPDQDTSVDFNLKSFIPEIIKNPKVVLTDLHKSGSDSLVHFDLIIPVINRTPNDTSLKGLLVLLIDPHKILYPFIQPWPTSSKSAEIFLIRRDGDEIVYLTELKSLINTGLTLRKSSSTDKLPAAMVINGVDGTLNGIDYRDIRVIAAMKKVPGMPWYLVSKIDRDEVLSAMNHQMKMIIIIIGLIILTVGLFLGFLLWNQRVRFYREKYELEQNRMALLKHFDYILKFANDIILLIDDRLNIVEINDRAVEVYQYSREELLKMNIRQIRSKEYIPEIEKQIIIIDKSGSSTFETVHRRKDGTEFSIELSVRLVTIEGKKYYQSIGRDISERKVAEDILRDSEERFRKVFEESPFGMVMTGKDFGIIRANSAFCSMIGYDEEELKTFTFRNFTHDDNIGENELSIMKLIAREIPIYHTEKRYVRKDKSVIWGSTTVSIIRNNKGEVQYFIAMVEDITSRKEAETELEKSISLLKATLESTADGILVVDLFGRIVQYNKKFTEIWRLPQELIATGDDNNVLEFVKDELTDPERFLQNIKQLYTENEAITSDLLEFRDGRFFERYSQPQKINNISVGRVWSFRDITERKKAEAALLAAKEKAEENDNLKTAFLNNVSHEIRTPMNAIIGFSSLLNETGLIEPERSQYTDIIIQSSNHLLAIINDIVDVANIETGQVRINIKETDLNSLLDSLYEQFSYIEKEKNVTVNLKTTLNAENAIVLTDSTKLIQILSNLINNAVKFTKDGQIDIGYILNDNFIEFFVRDTGIGISPEYHSRIFERFYQVDSAISRQYGGTGLGLSICKAYVELLGGKIWLTSQPGEGTIFCFTIPYLPA
jgi:PAS domain S-box-containing protein